MRNELGAAVSVLPSARRCAEQLPEKADRYETSTLGPVDQVLCLRFQKRAARSETDLVASP